MFLTFQSLSACALCGNNKVSWVNSDVKIYAQDASITKIHVTWKFDSGTSKDLKIAYAEPMSPTDKENMYKALETYQKPYFMTSLFIDGKDVSFKAENFNFYFEHNSAFISFDINVPIPLKATNLIEILFVLSRYYTIAAFFALLSVLVAWARIYLGVHFPFDMIGALILSFFVALSGFCSTLCPFLS